MARRGHFFFLGFMKKLELYYFDECPYCQLVLEVIKKLKLTDQIFFKNTRRDPQNREKLVKDTGRGTVPCLYIDDIPMHESRDIARWLTEYAQNLA